MTLHEDLRVTFGDTVAVVLDIAQDGKYAKIRYGDTVRWVLSSLLQPFSEKNGKEETKESLLPAPRYVSRQRG